jgi:hypothetical protein
MGVLSPQSKRHLYDILDGRTILHPNFNLAVMSDITTLNTDNPSSLTMSSVAPLLGIFRRPLLVSGALAPSRRVLFPIRPGRPPCQQRRPAGIPQMGVDQQNQGFRCLTSLCPALAPSPPHVQHILLIRPV